MGSPGNKPRPKNWERIPGSAKNACSSAQVWQRWNSWTRPLIFWRMVTVAGRWLQDWQMCWLFILFILGHTRTPFVNDRAWARHYKRLWSISSLKGYVWTQRSSLRFVQASPFASNLTKRVSPTLLCLKISTLALWVLIILLYLKMLSTQPRSTFIKLKTLKFVLLAKQHWLKIPPVQKKWGGAE